MRLHRLLGIMMLLDSRGIMTAKNLARILETSERTIYRDIDILCEAGIPIYSIPGPNGGYSFMENYKINSNVLESGDALHLLLSSMGIRPEKNTEMAQQLKNAVIKLENSVSKEHKEEIIKAKERFFIDSEPWWGKRVENKNIDIIKNSVLNLKKLKVCYKKYNGEVSERILRPYGAVVKNSEWYVIAFCELKNDIRVFMCNRIENIEVLDESFTIAESFSLERFWENSKRQFVKQASSKTEHNAYPVKLKFYEEKQQLLQGFHVHASIKVGDTWIYDMDMISFQTACSVIFPLSSKIEVLEPAELREYIIQKCNKILCLYNNPIKS
ncbi:Predicted DNA-binding transcriptional regulator YafY, contains an HTH and WYL domains [Geosporobacter subterraneus DSM 17957]|uniref:Predicted DNA-binding transcriptional regulator YafY, contains an HTH and WYL domains n=1 Tax=Geosporobacter subterraneus DSM 17957 TaxID=1121919 RepID=A0A1M6I0Q5_9FIRM|nr:YafY family protein [Geosporobacter subterraneus]SHJ27970.1 Predicted DNA-binding transcriptional regulator YafY, contains an HTH and WYL domains [Geosporobacter subterraneus DSM 17957]